MGTLYLVRHGQASFGADDYDQLSPLGHQQALRLGQYLQAQLQSKPLEAVLMGSLKRHRQTWEGIAEGARLTHTPDIWSGLNEYDSHALIEAIHPEPLAKPNTPELYRHHFRLLRDALQAWMDGQSHPRGMPSYPEFVAGIEAALAHVRANYSGDVMIVSSGGPIATMVSRVLQAPPESSIELNLRIRNTALTELVFNPKKQMLLTFNTLPHLDAQTHPNWITYA